MGFQVFSSEGRDGLGELAEEAAWARARRAAQRPASQGPVKRKRKDLGQEEEVASGW